MSEKFLEILFPDDLQDDDLEIIAEATETEPGRARLKRARIGQPHPEAPNSAPLLSWTGARLGFVAAAELIEAPYTACYWLEESEPEEEAS